jgi:transglutaminase-like putative cysteine protease
MQITPQPAYGQNRNTDGSAMGAYGNRTSPLHSALSVNPLGTMYLPQFGGNVNYEVQELSDDPDTQVAQTTSLMGKYVREDCFCPEILNDAALASQSQDPMQIVADDWRYVRERIGFVNDDVTAQPFSGLFRIPIVETLVRPRDMSTACENGNCKRTGDCDDFSMYLACLLRAHGIPCKFVTVAADAADPTRYSHVYVAAYPGGRRVALDASHGPYAGWEVENKYGKRCEWPIEGAVIWESLMLIAASLGFLWWTR